MLRSSFVGYMAAVKHGLPPFLASQFGFADVLIDHGINEWCAVAVSAVVQIVTQSVVNMNEQDIGCHAA